MFLQVHSEEEFVGLAGFEGELVVEGNCEEEREE